MYSFVNKLFASSLQIVHMWTDTYNGRSHSQLIQYYNTVGKILSLDIIRTLKRQTAVYHTLLYSSVGIPGGPNTVPEIIMRLLG